MSHYYRHGGGITLASSTLGDWISAAADLLGPLYRALTEEALASEYIQADETSIQVQDRNKKGKTHKGYYWVYHAPLQGLVVMDYQRGRGTRDGPTSFLVGYKGALQSDGYKAYDDYDKKHKNGDDLYPDITAYGCMAHARRYYFDAQGSAPDLAEHALKEIGLLYKIERELRESDSSPENRRRVRLEKAVPILERFKRILNSLTSLSSIRSLQHKELWGLIGMSGLKCSAIICG